MAKINDRVVHLISKTSNSKSSFSQLTGISSVILSHISSGRNKVSLTAVEQIINAFPKLNAEWLLLGKGQMFKDGMDASIALELEETIAQLTAELDRHHKSMKAKVENLHQTIAELKT